MRWSVYAIVAWLALAGINPAFAASSPLAADSGLPPDAAAAVAVVNGFDDTLLATMKDADKLGYKGRFDHLAPVVDKSFNLPLMTRFLIGPDWNDMSPEKQKALLVDFRRFTIGTYASRFDGYNGERFEQVGDPVAQKDDVMVQTRLIPAKGDPVKLNYLLRKSDTGWKIIDIYLEGTISQLATQRSEFQSVLMSNGVDGLITQLDKKTADLDTSSSQ